VLQAENILIEAKKEYREFLDAFKIRLAVSPNVEFDLDEGELKSLVEAGFEKPPFSDRDAISTAMRLRLDLANAGDVIYDAERKVHVAADALRAGLNIGGTVDVASEPTTDVGRLGTVRGSGAAGVELDLPLDRVAEQTAYRQSLIRLTQRERNYEQALDTVALEVRQALRDLNEAAERYRVQQQSLELAQERYKNTELLLQYGRANTRDVLDSQEDFFDAENAATSALVDFNIAVLNFYSSTGVLQVLPDGMWQAK
jgi:outer membrane protein TolC